jgi:NADH-quinone oxidoreductase subunit G
MNLAEICPVGALTSRHFRFKGRSWLMQKIRTLCPGCSRGCNVFAWESKGEVLRLTPAINNDVNLAWMCDPGRLTIEPITAAERPLRALRRGDPVNRDAVIEEAAARLHALEGDSIGVIASPQLTNEDLYAVRKLAREVLGTSHLGLIPGAEDQRAFGPSGRPLREWFIRDDKTPNTRGARDILLSVETELTAQGIIEAVASGRIKALLVFSEDLEPEALEKLDFLLVCDSRRSRTSDLAHLMLPESSFAEKDGTFTNKPGRVQRLNQVIPSRGDSRPAWQTAQELARGLGANWGFGSAAAVMDEIAAKVPGYQDISYGKLTEQGSMTELEAEKGEGDA